MFIGVFLWTSWQLQLAQARCRQPCCALCCAHRCAHPEHSLACSIGAGCWRLSGCGPLAVGQALQGAGRSLQQVPQEAGQAGRKLPQCVHACRRRGARMRQLPSARAFPNVPMPTHQRGLHACSARGGACCHCPFVPLLCPLTHGMHCPTISQHMPYPRPPHLVRYRPGHLSQRHRPCCLWGLLQSTARPWAQLGC